MTDPDHNRPSLRTLPDVAFRALMLAVAVAICGGSFVGGYYTGHSRAWEDAIRVALVERHDGP